MLTTVSLWMYSSQTIKKYVAITPTDNRFVIILVSIIFSMKSICYGFKNDIQI